MGQKKFRDQELAFVAEGPKIVNELLNEASTPLVSLFARAEWIEQNHAMVRKAGLEKLVEVDEQQLERISSLTSPNLVLGIFKKPVFNPIPFRNSLSLVLDNIQDPGNLGTMIRTADWFGLKQLVCGEGCADVFNSKTIQASMGSIARIRVEYTQLSGFLQDHESIPCFAAVLDGEDLAQLGRVAEGFILIGNESQGISPDLLKLATRHISIPKRGHADSLNAALAAGIILSHLVA